MGRRQILLDSRTVVSYFLLSFLIALCLGELVINPHQQQMEPFNWVLDWEGMLSPSSLVSLLDKHFFSKWLQVCVCEREQRLCLMIIDLLLMCLPVLFFFFYLNGL